MGARLAVAEYSTVQHAGTGIAPVVAVEPVTAGQAVLATCRVRQAQEVIACPHESAACFRDAAFLEVAAPPGVDVVSVKLAPDRPDKR
jgi:hypothetical protein